MKSEADYIAEQQIFDIADAMMHSEIDMRELLIDYLDSDSELGMDLLYSWWDLYKQPSHKASEIWLIEPIQYACWPVLNKTEIREVEDFEACLKDALADQEFIRAIIRIINTPNLTPSIDALRTHILNCAEDLVRFKFEQGVI